MMRNTSKKLSAQKIPKKPKQPKKAVNLIQRDRFPCSCFVSLVHLRGLVSRAALPDQPPYLLQIREFLVYTSLFLLLYTADVSVGRTPHLSASQESQADCSVFTTPSLPTWLPVLWSLHSDLRLHTVSSHPIHPTILEIDI